jgi:hypothetical protein
MANFLCRAAECSNRQTLVSNFDTGRDGIPPQLADGHDSENAFWHRTPATPPAEVRFGRGPAPWSRTEQSTRNLLSQDHRLWHIGHERMNKLPLLLLGCALLPVRGETLSERYAGYGELIVTPLASAPFPHPKRAEGHKYQNKLYPATEHYSDNTVAIFIPKGFRETGQLDFIVHFHGWKNDVEGVLGQYKLVEQLSESGRNAILVVPQGPRNAPDSFGGKLEDPDGFKRFMTDVADTLRQKSGLKKKDFALGQIALSGHSGGYQVISAIVDCGGLSDHVREVWLFDALYAQTDKFLAWIDRHQGRFIDLYTEHGGTKTETEQLMARLKQRGTAFFAGKEGEAKPADLQANKLVFLYTDLPHDDVVNKRHEFRDFLQTSCFGKLE